MKKCERKIINEQIVKIRKEQLCYGCGRKFPNNSSMNSCFTKLNNMPKRIYFCEGCHHTMTTKNITLDKFWYGDLLKESLIYERNKRN